jgi:ubiquinone/menaquinone biosynthesis C-methylase UbiE
MKDRIKKIISLSFRPFIPILFPFIRWVKHNLFAKMLNNKQFGRASLVSLPFVYTLLGCLACRKAWISGFSDYTLSKYDELIKIHYSEEGVGYLGHSDFSESQQLELYHSMHGRLAYFIKNNALLINYCDGDSFLDNGCGRGQNIKELVTLYPNSLIEGYDLNDGALNVIRAALIGNDKVCVKVGSVTDFQHLSSYPDNSIDHLLISHVLTLIISTGLEETQVIRQQIIDQLIRIAKKSVIILDGGILKEHENPNVFIEQNTRCILRESFLPYFEKHRDNGEIYAMFSPDTEALFYKLV